jgi:vacuolar-type H+-ATPase subunit H
MRIMERVWEELRKIETKAEDIHVNASKKSEELLAIAKKNAEKLLSVSKKHAEAEAKELLTKYRREASNERDDKLEKNKVFIKELRITVEKRFDEAVNIVFDSVLEKDKH